MKNKSQISKPKKQINKRGEIAWETVVKITIALIFLFIITMIIFGSKGKISSMFDSMKSFLRFG